MHAHAQVCTTLEPLPPERYIFMKLTYTDDTPEDYEPAGFRKYENADADHFRNRPFMMYESPVCNLHAESATLTQERDMHAAMIWPK